jgi:hypothetical protein
MPCWISAAVRVSWRSASRAWLGSVTAVDPEPEMLRIAAADAREAGFDIRFIEGSSYDIGPALGRFRLAVIGRAFHWMDRADTVQRLDGMIDADGALALFGDRHPELHENAWRAVYNAVLDKYSADDTARRQRKGAAWVEHESVLLASPFSHGWNGSASSKAAARRSRISRTGCSRSPACRGTRSAIAPTR